MEPTVGILGLGYLGSTLARLVPWSPQSWGTCRPSSYPAILSQQPLPVVPFDWTQASMLGSPANSISNPNPDHPTYP